MITFITINTILYIGSIYMIYKTGELREKSRLLKILIASFDKYQTKEALSVNNFIYNELTKK